MSSDYVEEVWMQHQKEPCSETRMVCSFLDELIEVLAQRGVKQGTSKLEFNQDYVGRNKVQIEFEYKDDTNED